MKLAPMLCAAWLVVLLASPAALAQLRDKGAIHAGNLRVVLRASGNEGEYGKMLGALALTDFVELAPPVPYRAALQEMLEADGLLLFQGSMCNHQIPAKLYEYFRAGRPLFTVADPVGNTADAAQAAGADAVADIRDAADIALRLESFLEGLRRGAVRGVAPEMAAKNSRKARTAELAALLNSVTGSSGH